MKRLLRQPVFVAGGREYCWADVVRAADQRGDWEPLIRRTRRALALLERSAETQGPRVSDEELDAAAQAFRLSRRLLTAEEMEAWLEGCGLSVEGWLRALEAELLLEGDEHSGQGVELAAGDADGFEDALFAQALVSGALQRLAEQLAGQTAVEERLAAQGIVPAAGSDPIELFRGLVLKSSDVEAHVRGHQEDFTRVVFKELKLEQEEMAREAVLAIRDDGTTISGVAAAARVDRGEREVFLKDLPPDAAARLFMMSPGELSEIVPEDGGYVLHLLVSKTLPSVTDQDVLARAEADLLAQLVRREVAERVKWLLPR